MAVQFLAGHPESSFHALLATAAFLVLRLWQPRRAARRAEGCGAVLAFGGAGPPAALAALMVIPFGELLWDSADVRDR